MHNGIKVIKTLLEYHQSNGMWDYVASIRGPDNNDKELKSSFTTVLRGVNGYAMDFSCYKDVNIKYAKKFKGHYAEHIIDGWRSLAIYYECLDNNKKFDLCYYIAHKLTQLMEINKKPWSISKIIHWDGNIKDLVNKYNHSILIYSES